MIKLGDVIHTDMFISNVTSYVYINTDAISDFLGILDSKYKNNTLCWDIDDKDPDKNQPNQYFWTILDFSQSVRHLFVNLDNDLTYYKMWKQFSSLTLQDLQDNGTSIQNQTKNDDTIVSKPLDDLLKYVGMQQSSKLTTSKFDGLTKLGNIIPCPLDKYKNILDNYINYVIE